MKNVAKTSRVFAANREKVYRLLTDYRQGRPQILPPEHFLDYEVEEGGNGAGTVFHYRLKAADRQRPYRMVVEEPSPAQILVEDELDSSLVVTWTLTPARRGESTRIEARAEWQGASGIAGLFERMFAPRAIRDVYEKVLERLAVTLENPPQ